MRVCLPTRSDYLFKVSFNPILRPFASSWTSVCILEVWSGLESFAHFSDTGLCLVQLLLIGDSGVGKSCLLLRFAVSFPLETSAPPHIIGACYMLLLKYICIFNDMVSDLVQAL